MIKIKHLFLMIFIFVSSVALADEGMWLPLLLEKLNEKEMKGLGMKISAKDIYSINSGSLKDAIVSLGGFCTAEIISSNGLLLTNHHCGFDAIQNHSTLEHNYIRDGYWARNYAEELPNPGLFATFIVRIEDVTKQALNSVDNKMSEPDRQSQVDRNLAELRKTYKKETYQDLLVRPFFDGNQYYLFVTETYRDVRLVGGPPAAIGNFGKDTDNWIWPRHTGDFSMFRIYAGRDNKPAEYSADNVPYKPKKSLSISLDGVSQNDFTMVFGFPGRTTEYLPAVAVEQIMRVNDPAKISIRAAALQVIDSFMRRDDKIKIQYAAKYANIENAYKKWQGEILGLTRTNGVAKKRIYEAEFLKRVNANPQWKTKYGSLLQELESAYQEFESYGYARDYYNETISRIELLTIAAQLNKLVGAESNYKPNLVQVKNFLETFYAEYNSKVDQKLFEALLAKFITDQDKKNVSPLLLDWFAKSGNNISALAAKIYAETDWDDGALTPTRLDQPVNDVLSMIRNSAVYNLYLDIVKTYQLNVQSKLNEIQNRINQLQRTYMQAQIEVFKEKKFYPDANNTMRVTYGKVSGYTAKDAVSYNYYTYLDGVMQKYVPGDYEFDVPAKLQALYKNKDYGPYGINGKMPVCFIASNHTTGGNSGSPALDAFGNLVGLNFDRVWEGTMSDINYDPSICRNIMVDVRYVLFIIDKYAGAQNLIAEMKLVHPKKK